MNRGAPLVRFVVVAYGRSEGLPAALDSIKRAAQGMAFETVVVLAPGDPAAARASARATVLIPQAGAPHTPGANRNLGARGATAPYLCFADGDVVLEPDFVLRAVAWLEAHAEAGGVGGRIHERQWQAGRLVREIEDSYRTGAGGRVEMLATAWLARRAAFEAVDGFDPRLPSEEDMELSLRLAEAGHAVHALDLRAAYHDCPPRPSLGELGRRWRTGLYAGQGVLLRQSWGRPSFARHLWRQRLYLGSVGFVVTGLIAGVAALLGSGLARAGFVVWIGLALTAVLVMAAKKQSLPYGMLSMLAWLVLGIGILNAWFGRARRVRA